jgi:hypothetical protein
LRTGIASVASAATLAPVCASPVDRLGNSQSAILFGAADSSDLAVVAVESFSFCTGTLVAPRVVVTAAHCITGSPARVFFGASTDGPGQRIAVARAKLHPAFDRPTLANDIAVLLLAEPAPTSATPVPLLEGRWSAALVGRGVRLVGFGTAGGTDPAPGTKRQGNALIRGFTDTTFTFEAASAQTCHGDSGGPALVTFEGEAVEYLAGVTSSGDGDCTASGTEMRVDAFLTDFIRPFVEETADGSRTLGQRCDDDRACATGLCVTAPDDADVHYCSAVCTADADCGAVMRCTAVGPARRCTFPPPTPRAFGAPCASDVDCESQLCARSASDTSRTCSLRCFPTNDPPCASGRSCLTNGDAPNRYACFASDPPPNGGCSIQSSSVPTDAVPLIIVAACVRRRRRTRETSERSG